jgi:hypothetical protein
MKTPVLTLPVAALFAASWLVHAGEPAADAATKQHVDAVIPKSVFVDDPTTGRDPFFPNSTRRLDALPKLVTGPTNNVPRTTMLLDQLRLKGISGTKTQPLALINNATVAKGETAEIKCGVQVVKIRCRDIRERSVLVELEGIGETKELKLREGI